LQDSDIEQALAHYRKVLALNPKSRHAQDPGDLKALQQEAHAAFEAVMQGH